MQKLLSIILLIVLSSLVFAENFEVISQNENELVVKFILPDYDKEIVSTKFGNLNKIICSDASYPVEGGYPLLPFFTEIIGLPIDGNASFQIIDKKQKIISNFKVYPTDKMIPSETSVTYEFYMNKEIYNSPVIYPAKIIEKGSPAYLGDRYFMGFNIHPFQYKAKGNELILTEELTFRIKILGDKNRSISQSENYIDEVGNTFFLNNDFSKKWRKEKQKSGYNPPRQGEEVNELRLIVGEKGIYKVTYDYLMETLAGLDFPLDYEMAFDWDEIDPRNLELSCMGNPVPIHFVGAEDGSFDPGDFFEFYGDIHYGEDHYYDDYTSESSYFLRLMDHPGSRMAVENGGLGNINSGQFIIPESYQQTIHFEEQNFKNLLGAQYLWNNPNYYREDIWFWHRINSPSLEIYPFELQYPDQRPSKRYTAQICLYSATFNKHNYSQINHSALININSSQIDQNEWNGQTEQMFNNYDEPLMNSLLFHGENNMYINLPGIPGIENQQVLLDYFDIDYWREYKTDSDKMEFSEPQDKPLGLFQFELENFSSDQVSVYKPGTSIIENVHVKSFLGNGAPPFKISFQDSVINRNTKYYAVTEELKKLPLKILPNMPSNLRSQTNFAKYLVITKTDFIENESLLQFKQKWEEQGKIVKIISLQDIFDEFNYGIRSAQAIKDFIQYAYNNWSGSGITHVLFLGDGITDERDSSPSREFNLIPFKNVWVEYWGAIASDNWLGCIVGDDLVPDVAIGRINIWKENQISDIVDKTIQYIDQPNYQDLWHSHVTLAAGGNPGEGAVFANQSEYIRSLWIPDDFKVSRVYCNTTGLPDSYSGNTTDLISNINDGTIYLQFMGHGGGHIWADYNLLNIADIATFNNDNFPLVASLSCYGSAFNSAQSNCLGEELILRPNRGAIGHFGFTGYGYLNADVSVSRYLTEAIFDKHIPTIGDITNFEKAKFFAAYNFSGVGVALIHGCALLGDPMIELVLPYDQKQVDLNKYNLTEGDTLQMSSSVGAQISDGKFVVFDEDDSQLPLDQYYPIELPVVNDTLKVSDFIVPENGDPIYSRYVKLFAYGDDGEVTGITNFAVGQSAMVNLEIIPDPPEDGDPINIRADFFDENGLADIYFVLESDSSTIEMINIDDHTYELENPLPAYSAGDVVYFHFKIFDTIGDSTITDKDHITVAGPDLVMEHFELTEHENAPAVKVLLRNSGSTVAGSCNLRLYSYHYQYDPVQISLLTTMRIEPLNVLENRWEYIPIPIFHDKEIVFKAIVNENEKSFSEINIFNNFIFSDSYSINMFEVGNSGAAFSATSLDNNLLCEFPQDFLSEPSIFYINSVNTENPIDQPDIKEILPLNQPSSFCYEIGTLDESCLADSIGHFQINKSITLTFSYNPADTLTQTMEAEGDFNIYRWENKFNKWIKYGGLIDSVANTVTYEVDRIGTYSILQNRDYETPYIEANIEGQEYTQTLSSSPGQQFTHGGYISKDGVISFILMDANGIDVFENDIILYMLDGLNVTEIGRDEYSLTITPGSINQIPLKYQLNNLEKGTYYINLECHDVNGNAEELEIEFIVNNEFDIINFANYPNPVKTATYYPENSGRTRFTYVLTDDADKVNIKIYTVSGRLVKTFNNIPSSVGYHEYPRDILGWDCRDKDGYFLANGVYFYRITATKGNKKIEKTGKMAILK
ncbi:MAG: C25 family cysteine peptidase [Candidatus Tenebribacter davisii]|nr:C25 family cysteine peptidase [Candidatus Tenebribacter davisii]